MKLPWQTGPRGLDPHIKARCTDGFPKRYRMCVRKFLTFIIDNKFVCSDYGEIDDLLVEFSTLSASPKLTSRLLLHQSSSRFLALWDSPFGLRCRQVLGRFYVPQSTALMCEGTDLLIGGHMLSRNQPRLGAASSHRTP